MSRRDGKGGGGKAAASEAPRAESVSLPVLTSPASTRTIARSKVGKWRAGVLIAVHLVIAAHIIQWLVMGMTVSPVEPSESMQTLEMGVVNAGFVLFALAILSTLIFGRFFCGWACHVVALQDLCGWIMNKCGVRPRPFRSRLLIFGPLLLGGYMFVWPSLKRGVIKPAIEAAGWDYPIWLKDVASIHGWGTEFIVEDFWATFAPWPVAIPFLFICGFAAVYFLGAKGFCTYGCPYAALFVPSDLFAPARIRVNESCEQSGHCTAVCTSNVRVHEEVRDYGMVVDPGCMKCMDCVSVCPNDALSLGFGKPALLARPTSEDAKQRASKAKAARRRRQDLSLTEEFVFAALGILLFVSVRGMLDLVPMLMAAGLAAIGAFLAWKSWRLLRDANVRLQRLQLKYHARIRLSGWLVLIGTVAYLGSIAWSGHTRYLRWRADMQYLQVNVPAATLLRPDFVPTPTEASRAETALAYYERSGSISEGGVGWRLSPDIRVKQAYLSLVVGETREAETILEDVIERGNPTDSLVLEIAQLMQARSADPAEILAMDQRVLENHPELVQVRARIAAHHEAAGRTEEAQRLWNEQTDAPEVDLLSAHARHEARSGRRESAIQLAEQAGAAARSASVHQAEALLEVAQLKLELGILPEDETLTTIALDKAGGNLDARLSAANILGRTQRTEQALEVTNDVLDRAPSRAGIRLRAGQLLLGLGQPDRGIEVLLGVPALVDARPWELAGAASTLMQIGLQLGREDLTETGLAAFERAISLQPDSATLQNDLAGAYFAVGQNAEGMSTIIRAAELAPQSVLLAQRAAQTAQALGETALAEQWAAEAENRRLSADRPD